MTELYKCEKCGKVLELLEGSGSFECCGQEAQRLIPNTIDAPAEKHVPVVDFTDKGVIVKVGSDPHPMEQSHYIEWIEVIYGDRTERKWLHPGDKPEASFVVESKRAQARVYCNLHGLWASE